MLWIPCSCTIEDRTLSPGSRLSCSRRLATDAPGESREERDKAHEDWPAQALYQGILNRNEAALQELSQQCSRHVSNFIGQVLESVGTAQDVEACTTDLVNAVWQEIASYDPAQCSLWTWVTMRARYIALDRRKSIRHRGHL